MATRKNPGRKASQKAGKDGLGGLSSKGTSKKKAPKAASKPKAGSDTNTRRSLIRMGKCTLSEEQWAAVMLNFIEVFPRLKAQYKPAEGRRKATDLVGNLRNEEAETLLRILYAEHINLSLIKQKGWGRNHEFHVMAQILSSLWERKATEELTETQARTYFKTEGNQNYTGTDEFLQENEEKRVQWPPGLWEKQGYETFFMVPPRLDSAGPAHASTSDATCSEAPVKDLPSDEKVELSQGLSLPDLDLDEEEFKCTQDSVKSEPLLLHSTTPGAATFICKSADMAGEARSPQTVKTEPLLCGCQRSDYVCSLQPESNTIYPVYSPQRGMTPDAFLSTLCPDECDTPAVKPEPLLFGSSVGEADDMQICCSQDCSIPDSQDSLGVGLTECFMGSLTTGDSDGLLQDFCIGSQANEITQESDWFVENCISSQTQS